MKQNMLENKNENNFKKEVDKIKNEIINEMNLNYISILKTAYG